MKNIRKHIHLEMDAQTACQKFIGEIDSWWPREYRWCRKEDAVMTLDVKNKIGIELSPDGEHIQWGQIVNFQEGEELELLWMMDPDREQISKPEKCSRLRITFSEDEQDETDMEITHLELERLDPTKDIEQYRAILDSDDGWLFLMRKFKQHIQEHLVVDP